MAFRLTGRVSLYFSHLDALSLRTHETIKSAIIGGAMREKAESNVASPVISKVHLQALQMQVRFSGFQ